MCVATTRILGIDDSLVNVLGSGCSLGHPIAVTGARMVISLVHELRRRGGGTGVAAMCAGGGMSTALVVDVAAPASRRDDSARPGGTAARQPMWPIAAQTPPSTRTSVPVRKLAPSDRRNSTTAAISSAWPDRPSGAIDSSCRIPG